MLEKKKKVAFILDHKLMDYRVPFFQQLAQHGYDLSIFHTGKEIPIQGIKQIQSESIHLAGFEFRKGINLQDFEIVVMMQNVRILNFWIYSLNPLRSFQFVSWGIGVTASSGLQTKKNVLSRVRNLLAYFADEIIFYSEYPKKFYSKRNQAKAAVSNNTIYNPQAQDLSKYDKNSFIFIGSLNKRKGLLELLQNFHKYISTNPQNIRQLIVIGEGPEKQNLEDYIRENQLEDSVILKGKVNDFEVKRELLRSSIASISLNQAGLSVLECFSFGVPFIANRLAISGGEHLNIEDGKRGFLLEQASDLYGKLIWMDRHITEMKQMGENAYQYYLEERTMDKMVETFHRAFKKGDDEQTI